MASDEWYQQIHERMLEGDPTAPSELTEEVLGPVLEKIRKKFPRLSDPDAAVDAVHDSLISYLKRPSQFDPKKGRLLGFLVMAAERDLRNSLAKTKRRDKKETASENVEVLIPDGNEEAEEEGLVAWLDAQDMRQAIDELFDNPTDRALVTLILDGERSTEAFSEILGFQELPIEKQRVEVKLHKDRIKKKLQRYGESIRERK
jgi:RNA polymerase sigma factor (sigma-70 family)